jgi:sigma-54 dependent transcriptional regulator, acetoin dehydrogenase operon transcriptional activator AcoR
VGSAAKTDAVLTARQRFFREGGLPEGLVAAPILRSWQRCASRGLDVVGTPRLEPMSVSELRPIQERNEKLRRLTRPEMDSLRADAALTHSAVILTDASGLVLDMVGNAAFTDRASAVALRPGVLWSEAITGTNAIGTALIERRPIAVHGAEHFFEPHRILACAAAPIVDPRGALVGALDMSGHAAVRHVHALGLVRLAVEQIEHRFFDHDFDHCTVLRFHQDGELIGTAKEGIFVFEGERLVAANQNALRLMNLDWSALDRMRFEEFFETARPSAEARELRTRNGKTFVGRIVAPRPAPTGAARPIAVVKSQIEPVFSAETQAALSRAIRLLEADIPVLVHGETGSGKEVFARQMHAASARGNKPFVAVNCAALPESLIEAELFGYAEGAFTGARRQGHKGLLRQADGGILFLDEIGDMPLLLQARLLRVLQEKSVLPLGGERPVPVDFALVCATHRQLGERIAKGEFRQDLYFRIAQYVIELPRLRDHDDRLGLIKKVWKQLCANETRLQLSAEAEHRLAAYDWPGNFRQLVSTLRALRALAEPNRPVDVAALTANMLGAVESPMAKTASARATDQPLAETTRAAMRAALEASEGNVSRAARRLGIDRSTLYRRLLWEKSRHS